LPPPAAGGCRGAEYARWPSPRARPDRGEDFGRLDAAQQPLQRLQTFGIFDIERGWLGGIGLFVLINRGVHRFHRRCRASDW